MSQGTSKKSKKKSNLAPSDEIPRKKVNKILLQETLTAADKLSMNLTDNAVINKMIPHFLLKFDLSDVELRKIFKVALHNYRLQNEIMLEKVGLLNSEERYEIFMKLKQMFVNFLEPLFDHDQIFTTEISQALDGFFSAYIPQVM
jgi:hypothetical protein